MRNTYAVQRLEHQVTDAALALDVASTALIRAQELADQDTTGIVPARLAEAKATLRSSVRMLADMLGAPDPPASRLAGIRPGTFRD